MGGLDVSACREEQGRRKRLDGSEQADEVALVFVWCWMLTGVGDGVGSVNPVGGRVRKGVGARVITVTSPPSGSGFSAIAGVGAGVFFSTVKHGSRCTLERSTHDAESQPLGLTCGATAGSNKRLRVAHSLSILLCACPGCREGLPLCIPNNSSGSGPLGLRVSEGSRCSCVRIVLLPVGPHFSVHERSPEV